MVSSRTLVIHKIAKHRLNSDPSHPRAAPKNVDNALAATRGWQWPCRNRKSYRFQYNRPAPRANPRGIVPDTTGDEHVPGLQVNLGRQIPHLDLGLGMASKGNQPD